MNILAIESSSTVCGAALFINNNLVEIDEINQPRIHGERLPLVVHEVLSNHSISVTDLDGIAVSSGPGSYTGLRIGMSLAKGLAMAGNIPIIPVPTLEVMNKGISQKGFYYILLHSHKNMVFAQQFNSGIPDSEIECVPFDADEYCTRFGFNMNSICKKDTSPSLKISKVYLSYNRSTRASRARHGGPKGKHREAFYSNILFQA